MATEKDNFIVTEQTRKLYSQSSIGLTGTLVNSIILAFVLWNAADRLYTTCWVGMMVLLVIIRMIIQNNFPGTLSSLKQADKWRKRFVIIMGITGIVWGASGVVLFPPDSTIHQAFIAFVLGGMVAGSVGVYSAYMSAFLAFSLPALLPIIIMFARFGDEMRVAMAAMIFLFLVLMVLSAKQMNKTLIHFFGLKFDNMELVTSLQVEIDERKKAETRLIENKKQIESVVEERTQELKQSNTNLNIEVYEHKKTLKALKENEEKYRDLVENINDVIYSTDVAGVITYISPVVQQMLGFKPMEIIGRSFAEFIYEEDLPEIIQRFQSLLDGHVGPSEYRILHKSGEIRWVRTSSRPVKEHGEVIGIRGILSDITEKKFLEEQLKRAHKMEAIGVLAGGVAHDLNNILSGLVSYPELILLDLPEDSHLRDPIITIKKSGQKAAEVVQDLLTLSRRGMTDKRTMNLNQVVKDYLISPEYKDLKKNHPKISLNTELSSDLFNIMGTSVQLGKMLMNLVINAAEAMPAGGKIIISTLNRYVDQTVKGYDTLAEGDYVILKISDNGIGISPEDQKKIYEPFYSKKALGRSGTGLGMAVVWGTVKDHLGHIEVNSREGEGAVFTIFFPVTHEEIYETIEKTTIDSYLGQGETILIVDDILEQREIGVKLLSKLGYRATSVSSGEEAIGYIRKHAVDLLVLDMIMEPGMDGYDTFREIVEIKPDQQAIIASGYSETDRVKGTQKLGAGEYIRKPYTLEKLGRAVRRALDSR